MQKITLQKIHESTERFDRVDPKHVPKTVIPGDLYINQEKTIVEIHSTSKLVIKSKVIGDVVTYKIRGSLITELWQSFNGIPPNSYSPRFRLHKKMEEVNV